MREKRNGRRQAAAFAFMTTRPHRISQLASSDAGHGGFDGNIQQSIPFRMPQHEGARTETLAAHPAIKAMATCERASSTLRTSLEAR
jgi:hypothetical protein